VPLDENRDPETDTQEEAHVKMETETSDGATSPGMPKIVSNYQKLEEKHGRFFFPALRRNQLC